MFTTAPPLYIGGVISCEEDEESYCAGGGEAFPPQFATVEACLASLESSRSRALFLLRFRFTKLRFFAASALTSAVSFSALMAAVVADYYYIISCTVPVFAGV